MISMLCPSELRMILPGRIAGAARNRAGELTARGIDGLRQRRGRGGLRQFAIQRSVVEAE